MAHSLEYYISCFGNLNCNKRQGETAPHKAVLLLAVMEEVHVGNITNGFIPHNERMVKAFSREWEKYVGTSPFFNPVFATPFFHLESEPFWELMKSNHYIIKKEYSLNSLRKSFFGAKISDDLFDYMENSDSRQMLKRALLEKHLPNRKDTEDVKTVAESKRLYTSKKSDNSFHMVA